MKYLSCPLCGEPEMDIEREETTTEGNLAWRVVCMHCFTTMQITIVEETK